MHTFVVQRVSTNYKDNRYTVLNVISESQPYSPRVGASLSDKDIDTMAANGHIINIFPAQQESAEKEN